MGIPAISSLSKEYVRVRVQVKANGVDFDPSADAVRMAFTVNDAAPLSGDWKTGSWENDTSTSPTTHWARCLVGPGGAVTLAVGLYSVWLEITDAPEIPIRNCGLLRVV